MRTMLPTRTIQNTKILIPKGNAVFAGQRIQYLPGKTRGSRRQAVLNGASIPIEISDDLESDDAPNGRAGWGGSRSELISSCEMGRWTTIGFSLL